MQLLTSPSYLLLELGQPMHAFDKDRIEGGIVVRMAKEGETLVLLDGTEAKLNADTLVIADHNKALAMGGIFGGEHYGVNDESKTSCWNALFSARCLSPVVLVVMACILMRLTVMSVALIRHCSTKRWNVRPVC